MQNDVKRLFLNLESSPPTPALSDYVLAVCCAHQNAKIVEKCLSVVFWG